VAPILVAGGSGSLGRAVIDLLLTEGAPVRSLSRRPAAAETLRSRGVDLRFADATVPGSLAGACDGVETVISCLGASLSTRAPERRSFLRVDPPAHRGLIDAAQAAGVRRFVYVATFLGPGWADTAYVRAHEQVVDMLRASGLSWAVVRPVGLFGVFAEFLDLSRRGPLPIIGGGTAPTNPIAEEDVARLVVDAARSQEPALELPCGGPDTFTRREIVELCFAVQGRPARTLPMPAAVMRGFGSVLSLFHPRIGEVLQFGAAVSTHPCVAPVRGQRKLAEHLAIVGAPPKPVPP
jgi:uncharacterized protein YbjT (DUF2867 family)